MSSTVVLAVTWSSEPDQGENENPKGLNQSTGHAHWAQRVYRRALKVMGAGEGTAHDVMGRCPLRRRMAAILEFASVY